MRFWALGNGNWDMMMNDNIGDKAVFPVFFDTID